MPSSSLLAAAGIAAIAGLGCIAWAQMPGLPLHSHAAPAVGHGPVVVELYQSQGCSSCPPAEANLNALADRADVIALSFGVTYWDYPGWKDSFASPANTARQWDYAHRNGQAEVFTPQIWVNGQTSIVGSSSAELDRAIATQGAKPAPGPAMSVSGGHLSIAAGRAPAGGADIWLVRYDPRTLNVPIRAGENAGRTLPQRDIVRTLTRIGQWTGGAQRIALPPSASSGLRTAVLLQAGRGGPILSAARATAG